MDTDYSFDLFYMLEAEHLRIQALDLYEQCLAQQGTAQLEQFIQAQLDTSPPPLLLFQRIADDLQQRLVSLQAHYFDARTYVVELLANQHNLDLRPFLSVEHPTRFHEFSTTTILQSIQQPLSTDEREKLRQVLLTSRHIGYKLQRDIDLTSHLLQMVYDWSLAVSVGYARAHPLWHTGILTQLDSAYIH